MSVSSPNLWRQYDVFHRYQHLARVLQATFPEGRVRVLDIGSGPGDLCAAFLPARFAIVLADTETHGRSDIARLVPGERLPFDDASFDAVLAMDVLEHVPGSWREPLLHEFVRVSSSVVVASHPNNTTSVGAAEELVAAAYRSWFRSESTFLAEHRALGLPAKELAVRTLQAAGLSVASLPNAALVDWLPFTVLDIVLLAQFGTGGPKDTFNRNVNTLTDGLTSTGDCYRTLVVATRDAGQLERVCTLLAEDSRVRTAADDQAIAAVIAATVVQLGEMPARREAGELLAAKDEHIRKLGHLMRDQVTHAESLIASKDEHIRKLDRLVRQQAALAQEAVNAKDEHIRKLELLIRGDRPASA